MAFKIVWKSASQWQGTETETNSEDLVFETREEAEAKLKELEADQAYMAEVWSAACDAQGVEGWIEIQDEDEE
jgi:hypothetical protein